MTLLHFVFLVGTAFRLQRLVTTDSWPPSLWFRDGLKKQYGEHSAVFDFFTCPWCFGSWITIDLFAIDFWHPIPNLILMVFTAMALVGLVGSHDG